MRSGWRESIYYLGEYVRKKKTNRGQSLLLPVNIAAFPQNHQNMFTDATNLATMVAITFATKHKNVLDFILWDVCNLDKLRVFRLKGL